MKNFLKLFIIVSTFANLAFYTSNVEDTTEIVAQAETAASEVIEAEIEPIPKITRKKLIKKAKKTNTAEDDEAYIYIERWNRIAQAETKISGQPASVKLAQGLLESGRGNSRLARRSNNHFGIKCFSKSCGKGHCTNHNDDSHKDFFRKYISPWESWRAHSKFLTKKRYRHMKGWNAHDWAHGLYAAGYATDKRYAQKLIGLIDRYDLSKFD